MRLNLTSGSLFNGLIAIGGGLTAMYPEAKWIGAGLVLAGILLLIFDVHFERGHIEIPDRKTFGERLKHMWPQYIMAFGAVCFLIGLVIFLQNNVEMPQTTLTNRPVGSPMLIPPIGSIKYIVASVELGHSQSLKEWSGQVKTVVENTTDKLIYFRVTTAGNINGVPFAQDKVSFDGYIQSHDRTTLLSARISGFKINTDAGYRDPIVTAIYEYDMQYRFADAKEFSRTTVRGLRLEYRGPLSEDNLPGTKVQEPITVMFYNEREE
jgi:hypothetical protein